MRTSLKLLAVLVAGSLAACDKSPSGSLSERFRGCDRVQIHNFGSTTSGQLSSGDCRLQEDQSYIDYYRMEISSTRQVTIIMRSTAIDPYLFLFNSAGNVIDVDDDGDFPTTEYGSRIDITLQSGTYYIGANSFDAGETGPYTLMTF